MGKTNLYTIVTNDAYELPVLCDVKVREAAEFFGCGENRIRQMVLKPAKKLRYKPVVSGCVQHNARLSHVRYELSHDRTAYFRQYYKENRERYHQRYENKKSNQAE